MPKRWRALLILTVARLSLGFQVQSIAAIGPSLEMEVGLSLGEIGMLIGLYYAPGIFLAFPSGMLGERFSDKRVIVLSLLAMTLGATVAALSPDVTGLMVGRLLSWVGELSALAGPSGSGGCSAVGGWAVDRIAGSGHPSFASRGTAARKPSHRNGNFSDLALFRDDLHAADCWLDATTDRVATRATSLCSSAGRVATSIIPGFHYVDALRQRADGHCQVFSAFRM
ncbi:MFS transporter [Pseudophaeobacter profundi]|uniref:MFS transporter n=1 Tax=Pseudophaeobacter profundi TaxID=3034152 RepID=UPI002432F840|nr:MFS transporter [Pseudophaeobacter profundi]